MAIPGFPALIPTSRFGQGVGGSIINAVILGEKYIIHKFTSTGLFEVTNPGIFEYVIGGGGGSAGALNSGAGSGGGGGGGVLVGESFLETGIYPVLVGAGGPGSSGDGSDSIAFNLSSGGGGGGGQSNGQAGRAGRYFGGAGGVGNSSGGGGGSGGRNGFSGGNGSGNVNGPGGSGGGARSGTTNSTGGVTNFPAQNGVVGEAGIGFNLVGWSSESFGIGGGGWGAPYGAVYPSGYTTYWGSGSGDNGSAPANRCGGGNGRASEGPGATGGSGVVYVRYRT